MIMWSGFKRLLGPIRQSSRKLENKEAYLVNVEGKKAIECYEEENVQTDIRVMKGKAAEKH